MNHNGKITLARLISDIPDLRLKGDADVAVKGIACDSRKVKQGNLFVAVPGTKMDGASFIPKALEAGAAAVLTSSENSSLPVPVISAGDVRLAMGRMAAKMAGRPDRELDIIGITGTNGKTTASYVLESILVEAGARPGVIGTVNYRFASSVRPAPTTTPESVDIFEIIAWMKRQGATHVIMEISSHALDQKRVAGLKVGYAALTNLSRDHLDYHRDLEDYYAAKRTLFTEVITGAWTEKAESAGRPVAVLNLDDPYGRRLASEISDERVRRVGCAIESEDAEVRAADIEVSDRGLKAGIAAPGAQLSVTSKLIGKHNLENILTATALALELGVDQRIIETGIEKLDRVPGRLEPVENSREITVLVDYAHTPDALEHAVKTCRSLARKRLITVFGCGGDRDPGKRPLMGRVAVENSDLSVVTSDNPRTEDPMAVIGHILHGVRETGIVEIKKEKVAENSCPGPGYIVEPDRKSAIKLAIEAARPGDMVLIAGKGHEDYQILGDEKIHFDDREEAENALKEKAGK